jgi:hypothetical protein
MNEPAASEQLFDRRPARVALIVKRHLPVNDLVSLVNAYEDLWIPPKLIAVAEWYRRLNDRLTRRCVSRCDLWIRRSKTSDEIQVPAAEIVAVDYRNDGACITVVDCGTGMRYGLVDFNFEVYDLSDESPCLVCLNQKRRPKKQFPYVFFIIDVEKQTDAFLDEEP